MTGTPAFGALLLDAQAIDWATLPGAYGPSDASDHSRDIPGMLRILAMEDDVWSADWADAYDDAFLAHVWHQYTLYPVTPVALGFLIRIASLRAGTVPGEQIGIGLQLIAESIAGLRLYGNPGDRKLGDATASIFSKYGSDIRGWLGGPLDQCAEQILKWIPEIRDERAD